MCRRCQRHEETLPHVLEHCLPRSALYQRRHNMVVERIKKAALGRWRVLTENQVVDGSNLRPDLVLIKENSALILDITVPFENGVEAFNDARLAKEEKYAELAENLRSSYSDVRVEAIVVGALGSWDNRNDRVVARLCSSKYAKLMRKLIVSDTIRMSRDIFIEHLTGKRQAPWKPWSKKQPNPSTQHPVSDVSTPPQADYQAPSNAAAPPTSQAIFQASPSNVVQLAVANNNNEDLPLDDIVAAFPPDGRIPNRTYTRTRQVRSSTTSRITIIRRSYKFKRTIRRRPVY